MTEEAAISILRIMLVVLFLVVFLQDLSERSIHVLVITSLFIAVATFGFISNDSPASFAFSVLWNLLFIALQVSLLLIYIVFRFRHGVADILRYIGAGDLLFWVAVCPLITFPLFVVHFIASLLVALVLHGVLTRFSFYQSKTIPLAGMQGVYYAMCLMFPEFY